MLPNINYVPLDQSTKDQFVEILAEYISNYKSKEVLGLVSSGGGSKGAYEIGFYAYMAQIGFLPMVDVLAGASVGTLNSLLVAEFIDNFQGAVDVWRNIDSNAKVFDGTMPSDALSALWAAVKGKFTGPSLVTTGPLQTVVQGLFGKYRAQSEMKRPVWAVTCDRADSKALILRPDSRPVDQALASSAVPCAFPAYMDAYMDGGVCANVPYNVAIEEGKATKVIVLYCNPDDSNAMKRVSPPSVVVNGMAALSALFNQQEALIYHILELEQELRKVKGDDPIEFMQFYPSASTGDSFLAFGTPGLLQLGYDDARKYLTPAKLKEFLLV